MNDIVSLKASVIKRKSELPTKENNVNDNLYFCTGKPLGKLVAEPLPQKSTLNELTVKAINDTEQQDEVYLQSKAKLTEKCKLYNRMTSSNERVPDDVLVDFDTKSFMRDSGYVGYESNERADEEASDVHYTEVLNTEIRDHGTAFYRFSADEAERAKQFASFKKLEEETEKARNSMKKAAEAHTAAMTARLKKINQKYQTDISVEELVQQPKNVEPDPPASEEQAKYDVSVQIIMNRSGGTKREWDRGKSTVTFDDVKRRCRNERNSDFAPPSHY